MLSLTPAKLLHLLFSDFKLRAPLKLAKAAEQHKNHFVFRPSGRGHRPRRRMTLSPGIRVSLGILPESGRPGSLLRLRDTLLLVFTASRRSRPSADMND